MITVEYKTNKERDELITKHLVDDIRLIGESNTIEGKFLKFATATEAEEYFRYIPTEKEVMGQQLVDLELRNLSLQTENQTLGQQLVDMDLRLLQGGL